MSQAHIPATTDEEVAANPRADTTPPKSSLMASLVPSIVSRTLLAPLRLAPPSHSAVLLELSPAVTSWPSSKPRYATSGIQPPAFPSLVSACPSLQGPDARFVLSPLLPTGHAQTIFSTFCDTVETERVFYARKGIMVPDGGIITLDVSDPDIMRRGEERKQSGGKQSMEVEWDLIDDARRTVVILHGLTGGSHESYARHVVRDFSAPPEQGGKGWRSIVVNFRGCANTPITSPQLYSAAKTSDIRAALLYIRHLLPTSPLVGIGFSLGANVLARYLGEEGDEAQMWGAVICAAPYDCLAGSKCLEGGGLMPTVYSKAMSRNLCRVARTHKDTLALHPPFRPLLDTLLGSGPEPEQPGEEPKTVAQLAKERGTRPGTLKWCDDLLVRHVGGYTAPYGPFPYEDADAYYAAAGAITAIDGLRRPILSLNSDDDPIVAPAAVTELRVAAGLVEVKPGEKDHHEGNPYIILATTRGGGHLGLWESRKQRWLHKPAVQFLQALFDEADKASPGGKARATPAPGALDRERGTRSFEVDVELLPSEALPVYKVKGDKDVTPGSSGATTPSRQAKSGSTTPSKEPAVAAGDDEAISQALASAVDVESERTEPSISTKATGDATSQSRLLSEALRGASHAQPRDELGADKGKGARMPWLRTHVLKEAPLVHPSLAVEGWTEVKGEMIKLEMIQDAARPEIGFAELPAWTRVAGIGDLFQGGLETPGAAHVAEPQSLSKEAGKGGGKPGTAKGMVAGL